MGYTNYPLDHFMHEGVKELWQTINLFILWNWHEIFLDGSISPQRQHIQLSQQSLPLSPTPKVKEPPHLPTPTETEAPKDKKASPV
jgi:hypothetical protein